MAKPDEIKNDVASSKYRLENQEKAEEPEEQKARSKQIESKLQVYLFL